MDLILAVNVKCQNCFISRFTNPLTVIFRKVEKKSKTIFLFYPLTLNIICFVEKKCGSVCVLLRVTLLKVIVCCFYVFVCMF